MLLSIIILNYKKPKLTLACINSLYQHFAKELQNDIMEIIIVDNHSEDSSLEIFQRNIKERKYKNCQLVVEGKNGGFSKGCNSGARRAQGRYLLFLNNDTQVRDKSILDMVEYVKVQRSVSIVGGELQNLDGSKQQSIGSFYTPVQAIALLFGIQRLGVTDRNPEKITRVDWVKGALFMIRAEVFKKLNGFDENIFMYAEDMELCYRAKRLGYQTYFYPSCAVIHSEHGSTNRSFAIVQIYKSLLYFYKKRRSFAEYLFLKSLLRTKAVVLVLAGRILHRPYLITTYEKALSVL